MGIRTWIIQFHIFDVRQRAISLFEIRLKLSIHCQISRKLLSACSIQPNISHIYFCCEFSHKVSLKSSRKASRGSVSLQVPPETKVTRSRTQKSWTRERWEKSNAACIGATVSLLPLSLYINVRIVETFATRAHQLSLPATLRRFPLQHHQSLLGVRIEARAAANRSLFLYRGLERRARRFSVLYLFPSTAYKGTLSDSKRKSEWESTRGGVRVGQWREEECRDTQGFWNCRRKIKWFAEFVKRREELLKFAVF